jgi:hypothetical protein
MVYVLTTLMGKEWRPVAVVDEDHRDAAEQWYNADPKKNDWVPLEMNDMSMTDLGRMVTRFKPLPMRERERSTIETLEKTNKTLIGIIKQLADRYKLADIQKVIQRIEEQEQPKTGSWLLRRQHGGSDAQGGS